MEPDIRKSVRSFYRKYGMDPSSIDIGKECEKFLSEMQRGLEGKPGSLKMIPAYVTAGGEIPVGEPVVAIDAGGTNFRRCIIRFDSNRKPVIDDYEAHPMPGSQGRISRETFFRAMAEYLAPVAGKSDKIGFCFSYPTEILPSGDGRLIRFCKEVQADGVEGGLVGKGLLDALAAAGIKGTKSIMLLNDTVATLLGGQAARANRKYGSYVGFILGTGTNTCYIESHAAIKKLTGLDPAGSMIINIESGAYDRAPRGRIDEAFDSATVNPGEHQFEKMISGGYFGDLALAVLKKAALDGLLSGECSKKISALSELGAKDANEFMDDPWAAGALSGCCGSGEDSITVYHLLDTLFERAAKLVAVNLSAVVVKSGAGQDPTRPVCVAAEGTMFHKSRAFRSKLECHIKEYLVDGLGLYCEFIEAENATLLGTAIAGLTGVR
jgi:hexokinase